MNNLPPGITLQSIDILFESALEEQCLDFEAEQAMQAIDAILPSLCVRNAAAEHPGLCVEVSSALTEQAMLGDDYAGLFGIVIGIDEIRGECLVSLDEASHKRFLEIERARFSDGLRDLDEDQWFCSGILEVVSTEESEK